MLCDTEVSEVDACTQVHAPCHRCQHTMHTTACITVTDCPLPHLQIRGYATEAAHKVMLRERYKAARARAIQAATDAAAGTSTSASAFNDQGLMEAQKRVRRGVGAHVSACFHLDTCLVAHKGGCDILLKQASSAQKVAWWTPRFGTQVIR